MSIGLTPSARRAFDAQAAIRFAELSRERAAQGDGPGALAAQVASDTHKVVSSLWSKAAAASDPAAAFFAMATQVMRPMLRMDGAETSAKETIEALRNGWTASMRGLNTPMFFSPIHHLADIREVTPQKLRSAMIGDATLDGFLAAARAKVAAGHGGRTAFGAAIQAHLVSLADQVGDQSLMSALARWQLVQQTAGADGDILEAAHDVLGPVEWVRLSSTLEGFGLTSS